MSFNLNSNKAILILIGTLFLLSSCVSTKKVVYFAKAENGSDTIVVAPAYVSKIQTGDIVSIYVNSLSPEASSFFNPYVSGSGASDASNASAGPLSASVAPGFLVDRSGVIEIPLVGQIKIGGLTTEQARDTIQKSLLTYLKYPTVNVRVLNYKISMLGEVEKPAVYVIPNEQVTLPEAISLAGDLTVTGRRDNVLIIRDNNGKKEFGHVDLTSRDVYKSPYYYLHSNDLVYVEPSKTKLIQASFFYKITPIVLGIATALLLIFIRVK